jgi:hypothetical protein
MAKKDKATSNAQVRRARNWLAVRAHLRGGAGGHKDKSKYSRKVKHKGAAQ